MAATAAGFLRSVCASGIGSGHGNAGQQPEPKHKWHVKQRGGKRQRRQFDLTQAPDHHGIRYAEQHLAELSNDQRKRQQQGVAGLGE